MKENLCKFSIQSVSSNPVFTSKYFLSLCYFSLISLICTPRSKIKYLQSAGIDDDAVMSRICCTGGAILLAMLFKLSTLKIFLILLLFYGFSFGLMGNGIKRHLILLCARMQLICYYGRQLIRELSPCNHHCQYGNNLQNYIAIRNIF